MSDQAPAGAPETLRVSRWRPASSSSSSSSTSGRLGKLRQWIATHKPAAAAAGGAVLVAAFALRRAHGIGGGAAGGSPTATDASNAPAVAGYAAGPSNAALLRQLERSNSRLQDELANALAHPHAPRPAHPPTPAPRPGHSHYTIRHGDTLATIARRVLGTSAAWAIRELRAANPALHTFGDHASLGYYTGHTIRVPKPVEPRRPHPGQHEHGKRRRFHHGHHGGNANSGTSKKNRQRQHTAAGTQHRRRRAQ